MFKSTAKKLFLGMPLVFIFIFFFAIEWRWEAMLLGLPDIKPHVIAAVLSTVVALSGFSRLREKGISYLIILLLICYYIGVSVLNIGTLSNTPDYNLMTEFGVWCINLALFVAASNQKIWEYIYRHSLTVMILYMLFVLPLFFLLWYSGCAVESNFNLRNAIFISGLAQNSNYIVSYQSIGDKLSLLTFIVLSLNLEKRFKFVILVITMCALFIVGSKASMVGYIFACVIYYFMHLWLNKRYLKCTLIIIVSICLSCGGLIYIVGNTSLQNSSNWLISTLARGNDDVSVSGRHLIEEENQETRGSRILLGDYKFDSKLGRPGTYSHSALGLIDYYGLFIFVIVTGIWFYLLFKLLFVVNRTPIVQATLMSMLFYTLLFTIARFPNGYLTFWVLGMATCAASRQT